MTLTNLFAPTNPVPAEPTVRAAKAVRFGSFLLGTADLGQHPDQEQACAEAALINLAFLRAHLTGSDNVAAKDYRFGWSTRKADLASEARDLLRWQERHGDLYVLHDGPIRRERVNLVIGGQCRHCRQTGTLRMQVMAYGEAALDQNGVATMVLPAATHLGTSWACTACQTTGTSLPVTVNGRLVS